MLRPFVGFAAEFIRIVGGFTLILTGLALMVAEVFVLLVLLGVNFGTHITVFNAQIPPALIPYTLDASALMVVNFFITLFLPTFFLALFGVMMLMRRILWQPRFGWSLVGLWLLSTLVSGVLAGLYAQHFQANGKTQIIQTYALPKGVLTLDVQDSRKMRPFVIPQLEIQGYEGKELKLMIDSDASGESEMQARANAQTLEYRIRQQKASLIFEEQAYYTEGAKFRAQSLHLTLYVPYGQVFTMQPSLAAILRNTLHPYGYEARDLQKDTQWRFEEGELVCLNCPNARKQSQRPLTETAGQWLDVGDFDEIEASGPLSVVIKRGAKSRIEVIGDPNSLAIENNGETLEVRPRASSSTDFATLEISLPYLKSLSLSGAIEVFVEDLQQEKLKLDISGASQVVLSGQIKRLIGDLSGASVLEAFQLETDKAALSLSGASEAKIKAKLAIEADLSGASELRYQGQPSQVDVETSGESTVRRE
ncbi:MAG: DUF2807 domain-containing protein [Microscillaceae bacterium]|nr:DUF2807 domain-containing protein [Microscillaceae bacterium]